ncbi:MAG: MerR family transcriptional regulator [Lachnospiraceae bacterium]|nr:MerR family transcriptional regulator [Lachnospiraceae bacterium]
MDTTIYTIKDVAARTGISAPTLRFYDKEGLLTFIKRSASGIRMFTEADFEPLYTIQCLKRSGMPLKKIKEFMDLYVQGNDTIHERRVMFEEQRENIQKQIEELQEMLAVVDYKCWYFNEAEKKGDVYYYRNLPKEEVPEQITDFLQKVKEFHTKPAE